MWALSGCSKPRQVESFIDKAICCGSKGGSGASKDARCRLQGMALLKRRQG